MNDFLHQLSEGRLKVFNFLNFLLAICTFYLSYAGLSIEAESFMDHGLATILAFASGIAVYVIWFFAFKFIPFKKKRHDIIVSWFVMMVAISGIIGLSSFQNATGAGGKLAQEQYTEQSVREASDVLQKRYEDARRLLVLNTLARTATIKYSALEQDELRTGIFSQVGGGSGAVHSSLVNITGKVDVLERDTARFGAKLERLHQDGSATLDEMRRILLLDKPLAERIKLLEAQSIKLSKILADMNPRLLAESVRQTALGLPDEIDVEGVRYSAKSDTARMQREAITRLVKDVGRTRDEFLSIVTDILESEPDAYTQFQPVSPSRAVRIMWKDFLPHWIAAITIDCIWLPILIWVSLSASGRTEEDFAMQRVLSLPLGALIDADLATAILRDRGMPDLHAIGKIRRANFGSLSEQTGEDDA